MKTNILEAIWHKCSIVVMGLLVSVMVISLVACRKSNTSTRPATEVSESSSMEQEAEASSDLDDTKDASTKDTSQEDETMVLSINETSVMVKWEDNESVRALEELISEKPLTIQMSMYGGFEQVGSIGRSLPRHDMQTTTSAGDIVLYAGNQIVVFYGSNSWAYTRLGHITNKSSKEMKELLGNGDITITFSLE